MMYSISFAAPAGEADEALLAYRNIIGGVDLNQLSPDQIEDKANQLQQKIQHGICLNHKSLNSFLEYTK